MRLVGESTPPLWSSQRTRIPFSNLPRDIDLLKILRSECCFLFFEFIRIWIAFDSQNSSEKLRLCHARSLRLMVLFFDPSSVLFVGKSVRCGSTIQRVRDISGLSVFTAIWERTLWKASAHCSLSCSLLSVKKEGFHVTTSQYISRTVTAWWGWKLSLNFSDGVATERSWACDIARSMSAVSGTVNSYVAPALRLLFRWLRWPQSSFCSWRFSPTLSLRLDHCFSHEKIYNTYDNRRLPLRRGPLQSGQWVWSAIRLRARSREGCTEGTRLSKLQERNNGDYI